MRNAMIGIACLSLAGCATIETDQAAIDRALSFAPEEGKAVIYAIRDTRSFPNEVISAFLKEAGDESGYAVPINLLPRSYGVATVKPGRYQVYATAMTYSMFDTGPEKAVTLQPGDVAIYRLTPEGSWSGTVFFIDELSKPQALELITKNQLSLVK